MLQKPSGIKKSNTPNSGKNIDLRNKYHTRGSNFFKVTHLFLTVLTYWTVKKAMVALKLEKNLKETLAMPNTFNSINSIDEEIHTQSII